MTLVPYCREAAAGRPQELMCRVMSTRAPAVVGPAPELTEVKRCSTDSHYHAARHTVHIKQIAISLTEHNMVSGRLTNLLSTVGNRAFFITIGRHCYPSLSIFQSQTEGVLRAMPSAAV